MPVSLIRSTSESKWKNQANMKSSPFDVIQNNLPWRPLTQADVQYVYVQLHMSVMCRQSESLVFSNKSRFHTQFQFQQSGYTALDTLFAPPSCPFTITQWNVRSIKCHLRFYSTVTFQWVHGRLRLIYSIHSGHMIFIEQTLITEMVAFKLNSNPLPIHTLTHYYYLPGDLMTWTHI